jgi:hypothetical protein
METFTKEKKIQNVADSEVQATLSMVPVTSRLQVQSSFD